MRSDIIAYIYSRVLQRMFRIQVDTEILKLFYEQFLYHSTASHEQPWYYLVYKWKWNKDLHLLCRFLPHLEKLYWKSSFITIYLKAPSVEVKYYVKISLQMRSYTWWWYLIFVNKWVKRAYWLLSPTFLLKRRKKGLFFIFRLIVFVLMSATTEIFLCHHFECPIHSFP